MAVLYNSQLAHIYTVYPLHTNEQDTAPCWLILFSYIFFTRPLILM